MITRNTIQKQLVLEAILILNNHPTIEEIYKYIFAKYPGISKGTVYRNVNALLDSGNIVRVSCPFGPDRFDHVQPAHYHIFCKQCGCFTNVPLKYQAHLDDEVSEVTGYKVDSHDTFFIGLCSVCKKKNILDKENN